MAYAGTSHIVGGFVTGFLDGRVLRSPDGMPFVFSSFQSKARVKIELDAEALEEEQAKGVTSVTVYETTNKPMVGALNLATGETTFAQGEEVYGLLGPWMATIAAEVILHRPPVYDPAQVQPWQYRLAATIGADKQLPGAPHPGLAAPQFHMSCALYAGIIQRGRAAVQGAPGTGKTRQTILTAAMLAYRWRHRSSNHPAPYGRRRHSELRAGRRAVNAAARRGAGLRRRAPAALDAASATSVESQSARAGGRTTRATGNRHVTQARRPLRLERALRPIGERTAPASGHSRRRSMRAIAKRRSATLSIAAIRIVNPRKSF